MEKQSLSSEALMAQVHGRLLTLPIFRAAMTADPSFVIRIGEPHPHERDNSGRNWNIEAFETCLVHWPQPHAEFRFIVDRLRTDYDMLA